MMQAGSLMTPSQRCVRYEQIGILHKLLLCFRVLLDVIGHWDIYLCLVYVFVGVGDGSGRSAHPLPQRHRRSWLQQR